jgi:hypothetical protein
MVRYRALFLLATFVSLLGWAVSLLGSNTPAVTQVQAQEITTTPAPVPTVALSKLGDTLSPEEYNYLPLVLRKPNAGDTRPDAFKILIIEDLIENQGYAANCANPQWFIKPKMLAEWQLYFDTYPDRVIEKTADQDKYVVKLTNAIVPMLRGTETPAERTKISSLEAFFGMTNPELPAGELNSTSIMPNLLLHGQQCFLKMNNLKTAEKVCSLLEGGSECYLDQDIPQTNFKMFQLSGILNGLMANYNKYLGQKGQGIDTSTEAGANELQSAFCDEFTSGWDTTEGVGDHTSAKFGISSQDKYESYLTALYNMSYDLNTLYRIAFLVVVPHQNEDMGGDDFFWFRNSNISDTFEYIKTPIIVSFKVPDFTMNKPWKADGDDYIAQDSSQIVAQSLSADQANQDHYWGMKTDRTNDFNATLKHRGAYLTNPKSNIYCPDIPQCMPGGAPEPALYQAIIDIVNALGPDCDGMPIATEQAGEIGTSTNLNPDKKTYLDQFYDKYMPQERSDPFDWWLKVDKDIAYTMSDKQSDPNDSVWTYAWVVSPAGAELNYTVGALKSFFDYHVQNGMKEKSCPDWPGLCDMIPDHYPLVGQSQKDKVAEFNASNKMVEFVVPGEPPLRCREDPKNPKKEICVPNIHHAGITLAENKQPLGVLGARLGWWLRKYQEALRPLDIQIICTRTEDLFLGKCQIVPINTPGAGTTPSSLISCPMELAYKQEIADAAYKNKDAFLDEIIGRYPDTLMTKHGLDKGELFDFVFEYAKQIGWNPALFLALGREETAWGAIGNDHIFGCMAGDLSGMKNPKDIAKQQMDCVAKYFNTSMSCQHFMCRYAEGVDGPNCVFAINPEFPKNLTPIYLDIVKPYVPSGATP